MILEACNRTMETIHQPSFQYTEKILKEWMDKDVHSLQDVQLLDQTFHQGRSTKKSLVPTPRKSPSRNKFNNFDGRTYENMDDLARKLIQTK